MFASHAEPLATETQSAVGRRPDNKGWVCSRPEKKDVVMVPQMRIGQMRIGRFRQWEAGIKGGEDD